MLNSTTVVEKTLDKCLLETRSECMMDKPEYIVQMILVKNKSTPQDTDKIMIKLVKEALKGM